MLSSEQLNVVDSATELLPVEPYITIGGYAGTGKTTIIKQFSKIFNNVAYAAFTGKAADVLRRKGIPATTIHSMMYELLLDEKGKPIKENGKLVWIKKQIRADCIIIDEASMVPLWIHTDLLSYGIPIIYVGDHGQLPPVGDEFNLMEKPDLCLETIHRYSGELVRFCQFVREGGKPINWKSEGQVHIGHFDPLKVNQVICGFNITRAKTNSFIRSHYNKPKKAVIGDRIMILNNDRKLKVFNGMQGEITSLTDRHLTFNSSGTEISIRPNWSKKYISGTIQLTYSYCITGHKAQGDEYETIGVLEEHCDYWEPRRHNYTTASRAQKEIYWRPA